MVSLFKIMSEIRFADAISQEIDQRPLKYFETFEEAEAYLLAIKNRMLMYNFPFAAIQVFDLDQQERPIKQCVYHYNETLKIYQPFEDPSVIAPGTLRRLNTLNELKV
jgi:hypothetical protein